MLIARHGSPRLSIDISDQNQFFPDLMRAIERSRSPFQKYIGLWGGSEAIDANYGVDVRSAH